MTHAEKEIRNLEIVRLRHDGKSMSEIAEMYGLTNSAVSCICKRYGVSGKISNRTAPIKNPRNQYTNGVFDREANAIKCITERAPNFEYVGGFTNTDGFVDVRCKTCGTVLHKSLVTIRHRHATCEECLRRESAKKQEEQVREREACEREKWLSKTCIQRTMTVCPCCGVLFLSSHGRRYCSDACAKRVLYALGKDKRIKKIRNAIIDRGITLKRLYERDNGQCYICGRVCDWSDYEKRNGVFIARNNYPSIDHVVPLSKGGLHAWDNVRLACRGCNTKKRDAISPPSCEIA